MAIVKRVMLGDKPCGIEGLQLFLCLLRASVWRQRKLLKSLRNLQTLYMYRDIISRSSADKKMVDPESFCVLWFPWQPALKRDIPFSCPSSFQHQLLAAGFVDRLPGIRRTEMLESLAFSIKQQQQQPGWVFTLKSSHGATSLLRIYAQDLHSLMANLVIAEHWENSLEDFVLLFSRCWSLKTSRLGCCDLHRSETNWTGWASFGRADHTLCYPTGGCMHGSHGQLVKQLVRFLTLEQ